MKRQLLLVIFAALSCGAPSVTETLAATKTATPVCLKAVAGEVKHELCLPFPTVDRRWRQQRDDKSFFVVRLSAKADNPPRTETLRIASCAPNNRDACHLWGTEQTEITLTSCRFLPHGHYCDGTTKDGLPAGVAYRRPPEASGFSVLVVGVGSSETAQAARIMVEQLQVR